MKGHKNRLGLDEDLDTQSVPPPPKPSKPLSEKELEWIAETIARQPETNREANYYRNHHDTMNYLAAEYLELKARMK